MTTLLTTMSVVLAVSAVACGTEPERSTSSPDAGATVDAGPGGPDAAVAAHICDPATAPTYEDFGQAFFAAYCTRCHSTYRNLSSIIRDKAEIYIRAAADETGVRTQMPRGSIRPTVEQRLQLGHFLDCL